MYVSLQSGFFVRLPPHHL